MSKPATIKEVASLAGVSVGTVSNYINQAKPIAPVTARRISQAIVDLHFVPNNALRTVHGHHAQVIGYVIPDATNPFFIELARNIDAVARMHGCILIVCDTAGDSQQERAVLRQFAEMRVRGVVLTSVDQSSLDISDLKRVGSRVVLIGHDKRGLSVPSLGVDDVGAFVAMQHLLALGRENIVFAGGPAGGLVLDSRFESARKAAEHESSKVHLQRIDAQGQSTAAHAALADQILGLDPAPDAILAGNDLLAIALMNRLIRAGVRVPEDVAIVGHDDIGQAAQAVVPLTTVRQPIDELGSAAARQLFEDDPSPTEGTFHLNFRSELIVRESTAGSDSAAKTEVRWKRNSGRPA